MNAPRVLFVKAIDSATVNLESSLVRVDEPTPAQAKSGNYAKRVLPWKGLTIRIENEAGSVRRGAKPDGGTWETRMAFPYGEIARTEGVDGDPVDVFIGPFAETADMVFVVHQKRVDDWKKFDEDKCMIGFLTEDDARDAFLQCYDDPRFLGPITVMPVDEFVEKVRATKENPKMIKSAGERPILFIKAVDRRDTHTQDMFSAPAATHEETRTRKDGVVQTYHVAEKKPVGPSGGYQDALAKWRDASAEFRAATEKYRGREIGDAEYLAVRKKRDDAEAAMDAAEKMEKKPAKAKKPATVTEPRADLIAEHKRLVSVLESPSHADDKKEAKKQAEELGELEAGAKSPVSASSDLADGTTVKDGKGREYRVHYQRNGLVIAHPIENGKANVSADTTVRFWVDPDRTPSGDSDRTDPIFAKSLAPRVTSVRKLS